MSHFQVGETLSSTNDLRGAFAEFNKCRLITERLVDIEPRHVDWNHDLVATYYRIACIYQKAGNHQGTYAWLTRCLAWLRLMRGKDLPLNATMTTLLGRLEGQQ
jgi:hypothetical protein